MFAGRPTNQELKKDLIAKYKGAMTPQNKDEIDRQLDFNLMSMIKKSALLVVLFTFVSAACLCQILTPVKWQFGSKKIDDKEAVIFVKATMAKGWHIYSLNVPEGGPIKTAIDFKSDGAYSLIGKTLEPKPNMNYEKVFEMDVPYFDREVVFQQKVALHKQGEVKVKGVVAFSACDAERCLPEDEVEFVITVR